jgi:hypothetical protein
VATQVLLVPLERFLVVAAVAAAAAAAVVLLPPPLEGEGNHSTSVISRLGLVGGGGAVVMV